MRHRLLPQTVAALSVVGTGLPARIELVRASKGGAEEQPWSYAQFTLAEASLLTTAEEQALRHVFQATQRDDTSRRAAWYLSEGIRLLDFASDEPVVLAAALLKFFHAIEAVSTGLAARRRKSAPRDVSAEQVKVLMTMTKKLSKGGTKRHVSAVREASSALRVLDRTHIADQIADAADQLGLPGDIRERAVLFSKFRNTRQS